MFEAFAIAAAMIAASAGQLSTSPEYRLHLLTVCKSRIAAVPEGKRASVLEKDAEAFAFLHSNQGTDDVAKAVRKEAFRRIESSVERWAEDRRIDFLVEASSHTAMHAPELTKKIGLLALEIAKPIVKKRFPMLLDSPKGLEQPWCEPLNFSKLKSGTRVQTDFDDEKFTANGHWWGGNGLIGAVPHLKSNDEFRYSLLMLRDGNSLKIRGFPRRRLTFDQSIVISNGPPAFNFSRRTVHLPLASATAVFVCPFKLTDTFSAGSAVPQIGTAIPLCNTIWSLNRFEGFTSPAAKPAKYSVAKRNARIGRVFVKFIETSGASKLNALP